MCYQCLPVMSSLGVTCKNSARARLSPVTSTLRNSCSSCRAFAGKLGFHGDSSGEHGAMIIFLKFLVTSQFSTAENTTCMTSGWLPHCAQADSIALGHLGDTITVITSCLRESGPLSVTPSRCASWMITSCWRLLPSCMGKWCHLICEPRGTLP